MDVGGIPQMNLIALGMHQAMTYWRFLFASGVRDDIEQEIQVAAILYPNGGKDFSLCVNRQLYALAKSEGFRKRHMNEMQPDLNWWYRPIISVEELPRWML